MSVIDPRNALERENIRKFGGIGSQARLSPDCASDLRNFRLLPDGSLEKRPGFQTFLNLPGSIRGTWEGSLSGGTYFLAVAGNSVYCVKPGETSATMIHVLTTSSGNVSFVYYRERLYLLDGVSLLGFRPSSATFYVAEGYTPLYGRNWHPTEMGEVLEPLNLIQNRIRLHYLNTVGSTVFRLPYTAKSVDRVKINGTYITNYTFTPGSSSFQIPSDKVGGVVEAAVTLDDIFNRRTQVLRACSATVYLDPHHETFLSFGGSSGYTVYRSGAVTNDMLASSTAMYGNSDPLYIPEHTAFTVGSIQHPVTALCQCGEQMLVFNDHALWALRHPDESSDAMQICLLRNGVGCVSKGGAVLCGDELAVAQENGIARLHFPSGDPDLCSSEIISEEIADRMDPAFLKSAILLWNRSKSELWARDPNDSEGLVWIYGARQKCWVCYDGIHASLLFERRSSVGFGTAAGKICQFSDALGTDDGEEFEASLQSHYLCFASPELFKRAVRVCLCADSGGDPLKLRLEAERGSHLFTLNGTETPSPEFFDRRWAPGRFRFFRYRVSSVGPARVRLHFLSLSAN